MSARGLIADVGHRRLGIDCAVKKEHLIGPLLKQLSRASMPDIRSQRMKVFAGIALSWVVSGAFIGLGYLASISLDLFSGWSATHAATFAMATASVTLIAGIGWAARTRHFVSNIDGSRPEPGSQLDLILRYVSNTTEQLVLFALGCQSLAATNEAMAIRLLPVMGIWFVIARALFFAGYRIAPLWRSVGFAATFHPTIMLFGLVFIFFA
jgi:uncharacterized membrane protein YecN with MAPEG domain